MLPALRRFLLSMLVSVCLSATQAGKSLLLAGNFLREAGRRNPPDVLTGPALPWNAFPLPSKGR
jgi:hypothetical protein